METITINLEELKQLIRKIVHDARSNLQLSSNYARILGTKHPEDKNYVDIIVASNQKSQVLTNSLLETILAKSIKNLG